MAHKKHAKLVKPNGGDWGRNEIAIMGAPCSDIKNLTAQLIESLSSKWTLAYVDADHNATTSDTWAALDYGAKEQLTNKISHYEIQHTAEKPYYFNNADIVLVNGNHFKANSQIAWVHPKKSLEKKLDKLTNVGMVVLEDAETEIPGFLSEHLADKKYKIVQRTDLNSIMDYFKSMLDTSIPPLYGLVLIGGKSTRMNKDKSQLVYHHDTPQYMHAARILAKHCESVFISVRDNEQAKEFKEETITDKFIGLGPYGGILSAMQHNPNAAWLVIAVDLPFLDMETIDYLVSKRNTSKAATCFIDPQNKFPEPLISIWEPRAYPIMLEYLSKGYSCPRKVLINSDVKVLKERNPGALTNVNTPEDLALALKQINE